MRPRIALTAGALTLVACSPPAAISTQEGTSPAARLELLVTLMSPIAIASRAGDADGLYVTERAGRVVRIEDGSVTDTVIDLTGRVSVSQEQGLVGLEFTEEGARIYLSYTDLEGDLVVASYGMRGRTADVETRTEILRAPQPTPIHNGGDIHVGPDGMLYIGLGDGGRAKNGQRRNRLLGKILRVDPRQAPYSIPPDNSFARDPSVRGEILHLGLRNPWRFSIDEPTQALWIGEVGSLSFEEIDRVPLSRRGANFGWALVEGTEPYRGLEPEEHEPPVYQYEHSPTRCAVVGGVVARDPRLPQLEGRYLFSDFCDGEIRYLEHRGGRWQAGSLGVAAPSVVSFGTTTQGAVVVSSLNGGVYRLDPV